MVPIFRAEFNTFGEGKKGREWLVSEIEPNIKRKVSLQNYKYCNKSDFMIEDFSFKDKQSKRTDSSLCKNLNRFLTDYCKFRFTNPNVSKCFIIINNHHKYLLYI